MPQRIQRCCDFNSLQQHLNITLTRPETNGSTAGWKQRLEQFGMLWWNGQSWCKVPVVVKHRHRPFEVWCRGAQQTWPRGLSWQRVWECESDYTSLSYMFYVLALDARCQRLTHTRRVKPEPVSVFITSSLWTVKNRKCFSASSHLDPQAHTHTHTLPLSAHVRPHPLSAPMTAQGIYFILFLNSAKLFWTELFWTAALLLLYKRFKAWQILESFLFSFHILQFHWWLFNLIFNA